MRTVKFTCDLCGKECGVNEPEVGDLVLSRMKLCSLSPDPYPEKCDLCDECKVDFMNFIRRHIQKRHENGSNSAT